MPRISRIKLQWGASRATPGDWYLGLFGLYVRKSGGGRGLAISLRGALAWACLFMVAAYFAGAGYYWWKQDQKPYNYVRYSDVLLYPLSSAKREQVRELQGQALIAAANEDLNNQIWSRGMMNLRLGLDRYPKDLKARLRLAQLFVAYRLRGKAEETIMQGLDFGWPGRTYFQASIELAGAGEDHELIISICDRGLALHDPARHPASERRWLIEQRIRALLAAKRNEEAISYAEKEMNQVDDNTISELRLLALLQAGRKDEAVVFAEAWRARAGAEPAALRLLARVYREAGRLDDMSRILTEVRTRNPASPRPHVFAMIQYFLAGRDADGRALLDDYIFRYGGTEANYALAAEPLAEIGRGDEVDVLLAAAAERGIKDPRLFLSKLLLLITEKRWAEATRQIEDIRASLPAGSDRASLLEYYQHLIGAAADPADGAQSSLTDYVRMRQLPMAIYRQCIEVLRRAGRMETARQIVTFADGVFPSNSFLAEARASLEQDIAARAAAAEAARPVVAPAEALTSAARFKGELDRVAAEKGPAGGLALLRDLRQARPAWMAEQEEFLGLRELELVAAGDDLAALQGAIRRYLTADRNRLQQVISVATRLHEENRKEEARLVLAEILRRTPGQPRASELMARWFPVVPAPQSGASTSAVGATPAKAP